MASTKINTIYGSSGSDHLVGGDGPDRIFGKAGNDYLDGGKGKDWLRGDTGDDVILGGADQDQLLSGSSDDRDTFVFKSISDSSAQKPDLISDFDVKGTRYDVIDLREVGLDTYTGTRALVAGNGLNETRFNNALLYGDTDDDGRADFAVKLPGVRASDLRPGVNLLLADPHRNTPPVARDDAFALREDGLLAGNVLADNGTGADRDPDLDPLAVSQVNGDPAGVGSQLTLASGALLRLNADGTFAFYANGAFKALNAGQAATDGFAYTIKDPDGAASTARATVTVQGVNDAPSGITLDKASVAENAPGAVVGNLAVADPDAGDTHGLAVGDPRFEVIGGQLKLKDGQSLDYETENSVPLTVIATDAGGLSKAESFTIAVGDVDDASRSLALVGQETADTLTIEPAWGDIAVTLNGARPAQDTTRLQEVSFEGLGGNDRVTISGNFAGSGLSAVPFSFVGGTGDDQLEADGITSRHGIVADGGIGRDAFSSGAGDDVLRGGDDNDTLYSRTGLDRLYGQAGDDELRLDDAIAGDVADGGEGTDTLTFNGSSAWVSGDVMDASGGDLVVNGVTIDLVGIESLHLNGLEGDDDLMGYGGRDWLIGGGDHDRLNGNHGDDHLDGGKGRDWLYGGEGDDYLVLDDATTGDVADGAGGSDTLRFNGSSAGDVMDASNGYHLVVNGVAVQLTSIESLHLDGAEGDDTLIGSRGSGQNDWLIGGGGRDQLYGNWGQDRLDGGGEDDTMRGDQDADAFVLAPGSGQDTILDFEDGASGSQDLIDVSAYGITRFEQLSIGGNLIDLGASAGGTAGANTVALTFSSGNMAGLTSEDFIFAA